MHRLGLLMTFGVTREYFDFSPLNRNEDDGFMTSLVRASRSQQMSIGTEGKVFDSLERFDRIFSPDWRR